MLEETDSNSEFVCRRCGGDSKLGSLISPCRCKGDRAWVHQGCIKNKEQCTKCGVKFNIIRSTNVSDWKSFVRKWIVLVAMLCIGILLTVLMRDRGLDIVVAIVASGVVSTSLLICGYVFYIIAMRWIDRNIRETSFIESVRIDNIYV
jgi:energy-converting hydrogenase Eha subunit C